MGEKLRELILYISQRSEGDAPFTAAKLSRLLYYCDFAAYAHLGQSISGAEYRKSGRGPEPVDEQLLVEVMKRDGDLAVRKAECQNRNQQRPLALREATLSPFTAEQIDLVNRAIRQFWGKPASYIVEDPQELSGWMHMELGETIPYETAFVSRRSPSQEEIARCRAILEKDSQLSDPTSRLAPVDA